MEKIKEYLENRLVRLNYELGYFEDDDEGNNSASAKRTKEEIDEINKLLISRFFEKVNKSLDLVKIEKKIDEALDDY